MLTVALVTPSYNQAEFLDDALRSVLDQGYPHLEYVVADGGSTDGSREIVERYAGRLKAWWSQPDGGHADAVNRGFAETSGEIMGWLNSDDLLFPRTLWTVVEIFEALPEVEWITSGFLAGLDASGKCTIVERGVGFSRTTFELGLHAGLTKPYQYPYIQQESTFWRRSLWERAGGRLDIASEPAADFELWARFFRQAELYTVDTLIGAFRYHPAQRTASLLPAYTAQAKRILGDRERFVPPSAAARMKLSSLMSPRALSLLRLGWKVPFIRWERRTGAWYRAWRRLP